MLIQAARTDFQVRDEGTGSPILLVHGFPLDHSMWNGQWETLTESYHVIAPDLRGFGLSGGAKNVITMADFADDLAEILDMMRVDEPITFCGLSMGGYIAWEFLRLFPERVQRLILCDTRASADTETVRQSRVQLAERVLEEGTGFLAQDMSKKLFSPLTRASQPELVTHMESVMRSCDPLAVAGATLGMSQRRDFTDFLTEIEIPALLICGSDDAITPVSEMQTIADQMPQAKLEIIPGAGHMAPLEAPAAVNAAILNFLGETDA
ncbi:MAG: alpha/beta fold hydrolase [Planctomycetaceae bacterium]|nr:alpha/beta fold hydrolase [Planctomycetaceae bacterium]